MSDDTFRYTVNVETPTGRHTATFDADHHVGAILGEVLARQGRRNDGSYQLVYSQTPIDPTDTLRSSPIDDGGRVFLESNPAGGI